MAGGSRGGETDSAFPPIRKSLGQHFLTDPAILSRIVDALDPGPEDLVLEVGPGRGSLTDALLPRVGRVIAIEYDRALAARLRERYAAEPRFSLIEGNVLETNLGEIAGGPYKLVGNVPYYITTPILFHALERPRPGVAVYLVQREVAERIVAPAGSDEYGALSVNVQALARATLMFRVAAGAFHPPPKVESAVIRIVPREDPVVRPEAEAGFSAFVQALFGMRRKQMTRAVREVLKLDAPAAAALLEEAKIAPDARVETLGAAALAALYEASGTGNAETLRHETPRR